MARGNAKPVIANVHLCICVMAKHWQWWHMYVCGFNWLWHLLGYKSQRLDGNSAWSATMYSCASSVHTSTGPSHRSHDGSRQELWTSDHCQKDFYTVGTHISSHFCYFSLCLWFGGYGSTFTTHKFMPLFLDLVTYPWVCWFLVHLAWGWQGYFLHVILNTLLL